MRWPWRRSPTVEEVRVEAAVDLRDGILEARADRIAELEQLREAERHAHAAEVDDLRAQLRLALMPSWTDRGRRAQATLDGPTAVLPTGRSWKRDVTEVTPRRRR